MKKRNGLLVGMMFLLTPLVFGQESDTTRSVEPLEVVDLKYTLDTCHFEEVCLVKKRPQPDSTEQSSTQDGHTYVMDSHTHLHLQLKIRRENTNQVQMNLPQNIRPTVAKDGFIIPFNK